MKFLLLLLIAVAAGGFFLPAQQEGTTSACAALEMRVHRLADAEIAKLPLAIDQKLQPPGAAGKPQAPTGAMIETVVREKLPFLPPEIGCATAYWITVFQPDLRQLAPGLLPRPPAG